MANVMSVQAKKKEEAELVKQERAEHEKMIERQRALELERAAEVKRLIKAQREVFVAHRKKTITTIICYTFGICER